MLAVPVKEKQERERLPLRLARRSFPPRFLPSSLSFSLLVLIILPLSACVGGTIPNILVPVEARLMKYHLESNYSMLEDFTNRLYARNPKYEPDPEQRKRKVAQIFHKGPPVERYYSRLTSDQVLSAAFSPEPDYPDRVYLLALGLSKSLLEAYDLENSNILWPGVKVKVERLKRLHHNLSQVNWRLKTYKDDKDELLFLTYGFCDLGYLNMGYEVIMTRILSNIESDIVLMDGMPGRYVVGGAASFLGLLI